ncbi:MAG TPA: rhomboid family intramembrane serine protease [Candidatus Limnocylindrales bacterium]|nr:rhomboid family intramembrane serine protease [Candidatus Limnocylindrales bacterium]
MDDPALDAAVASTGPLDGSTARRLLDRARDWLERGEPAQAAAHFRRVIGHADAQLTAEAWLGFGDALFRMDHDADALRAWESVTQMPETPVTYRAWRQIAAERVRQGDIAAATKAYREAERRAPPGDRAEIASRLGWLNKEQGRTWTAGRYFARSRGTGLALSLSNLILAVTVVVSLIAILSPDTTLFDALALDRRDVVHGELYRLLSVTLLHANFLHLFFNMYALYLIGPIVEGIWGSRWFGALYLLTAIAASTTSVVFSPGPAVGASGAIFGLIGVVFAGTRFHHPVLDQRARAIVPQLGFLIVINLILGFSIGGIDNAAHIGGLVSGLWLGLVVPPGRVPTLRSMWQNLGSQSGAAPPLIVAAGVLAVIAAILVGLSIAGVRL